MTRHKIASLLSVVALVALSLTAAAPAQAAVQPAVNCNQQPTTNDHLDSFVFQNTFMRPGPSRSCQEFWTTLPSDNVTIHCLVEGDDGYEWFYYTDHSPSPHTGWSRGVYFAVQFGPEHC